MFGANSQKGSNPSVERLSKDGKKGAEPSPSAMLMQCISHYIRGLFGLWLDCLTRSSRTRAGIQGHLRPLPVQSTPGLTLKDGWVYKNLSFTGGHFEQSFTR